MNPPIGFASLVELCRSTHAASQLRAGRIADAYLTARNWLLGWYIVEFEQSGADRAVYGSGLLQRLAGELGKGFSTRSLHQFRAFYLHWKSIRQTLSTGSLPSPEILATNALQIRQTLSAELLTHFNLGWSHYVELLTIDSPDEPVSTQRIEGPARTNHP